MSGHNKWSTIKHKKGAADAKRGRIFTRIIREVTIAARTGGGDPGHNARLRSAITAARAANMPSDNIERAIKRGTGELEGVNYEEVTYEGYGPGGAAVLVETLTDNRNRTVGEVRHIFTKHNGNMGESGCVSWMFSRVGVVTVPKDKIGEEELFERALEAGADDVRDEGGRFEVHCAHAGVHELAERLRTSGVAVESGSVAMVPQTTIKLQGREAEVMLRLYEALEDNDDVQNVWSNFDIDDALLEQLAG